MLRLAAQRIPALAANLALRETVAVGVAKPAAVTASTTRRTFVDPVFQDAMQGPGAKKTRKAAVLASAETAPKTEAEAMLCGDANATADQPPKLQKKRKTGNSFRDLGCY